MRSHVHHASSSSGARDDDGDGQAQVCGTTLSAHGSSCAPHGLLLTFWLIHQLILPLLRSTLARVAALLATGVLVGVGMRNECVSLSRSYIELIL